MKTIIKNKNNKPSRKRYKLEAFIIILCLLMIYIYAVTTWKSQSQKASEEIIRLNAAPILVKEANQLTDDDFAKIKYFDLKSIETNGVRSFAVELSDIKLIGKFINLEELHLHYIRVPNPKTSTIFTLFKQLHKTQKSPNNYIDLSPLKKLTKLEKLSLYFAQINDITPLAFLTNLKELDLRYSGILDIEPLCELPNLEKLVIEPCSINNLEQITRLKSLKELILYGPITPEDEKYLEEILPNLNLKIVIGGSVYHNPTPIRKFPETKSDAEKKKNIFE